MDDLEKALKDVGINDPKELGLNSFNELGKPKKEVVLNNSYHNFSQRKIDKVFKKSLFIFKNVI